VTSALWRLWYWLKFQLWQRRRFNRLILEEIAGRPFLILPEVFNPTLFFSSEFMVSSLNETLIPPGSTVLDMGSGSGVGAVFAARWATHVVATDINPAAVRCARINVLLNEVEGRVDVREGDLFEPVAGLTFDVVLFNPPYYRGQPHSVLDRAFHASDVVERFATALPGYLRQGGCAFMVLSSSGDEAAFLRVFEEQGFAVEATARKELRLERLTLYRLNGSAITRNAPN